MSDLGWLRVWRRRRRRGRRRRRRRLFSNTQTFNKFSRNVAWQQHRSARVRSEKWGRLIAAAASLTASLTGSYLSELSETRSEHILISPPPSTTPAPAARLVDAFAVGRFHLAPLRRLSPAQTLNQWWHHHRHQQRCLTSPCFNHDCVKSMGNQTKSSGQHLCRLVLQTLLDLIDQ